MTLETIQSTIDQTTTDKLIESSYNYCGLDTLRIQIAFDNCGHVLNS